MPMRTFERTWQRAGHWAVVTLMPGQIPETLNADNYFRTVAEFEALHPDDVEMAWQAGYQRWPDQPLIAMGLSNWMARSGQQSRAIDVLQKLLIQHPNFAPARQNLQVLQSSSSSRL